MSYGSEYGKQSLGHLNQPHTIMHPMFYRVYLQSIDIMDTWSQRL